MSSGKGKIKSGSCRDCPFKPGVFYRVSKDFRSYDHFFQKDDVYQFVEDIYSRYDGVTFYEFVGGTWEQRNEEPHENWSEYFEEIPSTQNGSYVPDLSSFYQSGFFAQRCQEKTSLEELMKEQEASLGKDSKDMPPYSLVSLLDKYYRLCERYFLPKDGELLSRLFSLSPKLKAILETES
jgi:hypothetical protein